MFKLYKKMTLKDWLLILLIIGFTILQVYSVMTMTDYVSGVIKSITYLNYHNNPASMGTQFYAFYQTAFQSDWANVTKESLATYGIEGTAATTLLSIASASTHEIWMNGLYMVLLALASASCQVVNGFIASYVSADLATHIRRDVNKKISSFSLEEVNKFSTASLITRATNDTQRIQMSNMMLMNMVFGAPITAIWALCKIQASSGELTLVTGVAIFGLVIGIVALILLVLPKFKSMQKLLDRVNGLARDNLTGIRVVRAFNAEAYEETRFQKANKDLADTQIFTGRVMGLLSPLMMIVMNGLTLGIYWVGATLINKGAIDYATVTAFMMLASEVVMAFVMLIMLFVFLPRAEVSARRINEVLETPESIKDPEEEKPVTGKGEVEFQHVSFRYPGGKADVLEDISFKAEKGQVIAFIGSTGSGKSTLVTLITRLFDATSGAVKVDGVDVKDLKQKTLRSLIGYVPQQGLLFSGTIRENIAFTNPTLNDEEIMKAAKIAEADEFIQQMDGGYEAKISQGGKNVSGGQKQRLCIARALASKPEVLIFDDSFSALDYRTDAKLRANLKEYESGITKIIVAQRIGTIMDADEIFVLEDGKVVGQGKHEELMKNCPTYASIALSQLSKEELGL